MPFISENVVNTALTRKSATSLSTSHILIRPLTRPQTKYGVDTTLRTTFMPASYRNAVDAISRVEIRPDDIWVVGFPKSGDIIVQDLVWNLINANRGEERVSFRERTPLLERTAMTHPSLNKTFRPSWELIQRLDSPRVLRTNLPLLLLPSGIWRIRPRIIYVTRHDSQELAAEYYQDYVQMQGYKGSLEEFVELLNNDLVAYAPYNEHVHDFKQLQDVASNILNVDYTENQEDMEPLIKKIVDFLEITQLTEEREQELIKSLSNTEEEAAKAYQEDVQTMDKIFKRKPTLEFQLNKLKPY